VLPDASARTADAALPTEQTMGGMDPYPEAGTTPNCSLLTGESHMTVDTLLGALRDLSDAKLQEAVFAEINQEPSLDKAQIGVEVVDGEVTLEGQVNTESARADAERAALRVPGLDALTDTIDVTPPAVPTRDAAPR
jgi:hypothetical protein